jgi:putative membrane protein
MAGYEAFWADFGWWWIFPVAMIVLCVFMMRGRTGCMTGWSTYRSATTTPAIAPSDSATTPAIAPSDSAREILDKRYALGEINKEEYEEKRRDIDQTDR